MQAGFVVLIQAVDEWIMKLPVWHCIGLKSYCLEKMPYICTNMHWGVNASGGQIVGLDAKLEIVDWLIVTSPRYSVWALVRLRRRALRQTDGIVSGVFDLGTYNPRWFPPITTGYLYSLLQSSCAHMENQSRQAKSIKHTVLKLFTLCRSRTKGTRVIETPKIQSRKSINSVEFVYPTNQLIELPSNDTHDNMTTSSSQTGLVSNVSILSNGMNKIIMIPFRYRSLPKKIAGWGRKYLKSTLQL